MKVIDIIYQGGGMLIAFDDGSNAVAQYKLNKQTHKVELFGLNETQKKAIDDFNAVGLNIDDLDVDARFRGAGGASAAIDVSYDNSISGSPATNVQDALDDALDIELVDGGGF